LAAKGNIDPGAILVHIAVTSGQLGTPRSTGFSTRPVAISQMTSGQPGSSVVVIGTGQQQASSSGLFRIATPTSTSGMKRKRVEEEEDFDKE